MYFKQFLDERCGCASYVIASRQSHEAAVVDPALTVEQYDALLRDRDFQLRYVIDTHVHADHVSGARILAQQHGATLCLHESARLEYPFHPLSDGDRIALGQLELRVVHTPGHRPELISLLIVNPPRSPEPSMVLTGDSLLVGDVGRPDFGGGDAEDQYASLTRLMELPDWVAVFPGHFEGPCGKGMCGRPTTTIGFERLYNPLTQLKRAAFIAALSDAVPARPLNMVAIEATNRGAAACEWAMLTSTAPIHQISNAEIASLGANAVLLDVREPQEYATGHIPKTLNVPQAELASRLDEIPKDRPIVTICQVGYRSLRAAQFLRQVGFDSVCSLIGGTESWRGGGHLLESAESPAGPRITETEWSHAGGTT